VATWTVPELQAARYLALRLPQAVVAEKCFITDRQLRRWMQRPGFVELMQQAADEIDQLVHNELSGFLYDTIDTYRRWVRGEVDLDDKRLASLERTVNRCLDRILYTRREEPGDRLLHIAPTDVQVVAPDSSASA
jgi:hypothetical protein